MQSNEPDAVLELALEPSCAGSDGEYDLQERGDPTDASHQTAGPGDGAEDPDFNLTVIISRTKNGNNDKQTSLQATLPAGTHTLVVQVSEEQPVNAWLRPGSPQQALTTFPAFPQQETMTETLHLVSNGKVLPDNYDNDSDVTTLWRIHGKRPIAAANVTWEFFFCGFDFECCGAV